MTKFQQFERPRFFAGQLLTADDLQLEQDYVVARLRRHNRFAHGWGIVSGLEVAVDAAQTLVVAPGLALDCAGNEIVLATLERLSLAGLTGRHHVTIRYVELPAGLPTPSIEEQTTASRVREAACVELAVVNPGAGHARMGPGTAGCGEPHALCLATLSQRGSGWHIRATKRVRRGR